MDIPQSFIACVQQALIRHWNENAFTDYKGDTLRYCDVARRIAKLHIGMATAGLHPGDKVAICGRNSANWAVAFFGAITYGCVVVPIQCEFQPEQVHNIVNHSESRFLFVGDGVAKDIDFEKMPNLGGIAHLPDLTIRNTRSEKVTYVHEHLNQLFGERYPARFCREHVVYTPEAGPDALAIINYTSGTTGFSKGVMIPYRALWGNLDFALRNFGPHVHAGDRMLSTLPMAHTYGLACEIIFGFLNGCHIHFLLRQPAPSLVMEAAAQVKPAILLAVPIVVEKIVRKHVYQRLDVHRARYLLQIPLIRSRVKQRVNQWIRDQFGGNIYEIVTGGAPMSLEIEQFLMSVGFPITSGYGTTETAPMITYSDWNDHVEGSCGTVVPHMELALKTRDGRTVRAGEKGCEQHEGEIITRGMHVMLGYYKNDAATREVIDGEGWYHTGDLGSFSPDGHLFLKGRIKNMLLGSNGQNVYPEEIEDKLNSMPMVAESLVLQDGDNLVALVYPDPDDVNQIPLSTEEVNLIMEQNRQELNAQLPTFCRLKEIRLHHSEFEKTAKKSIKRYLYKA